MPVLSTLAGLSARAFRGAANLLKTFTDTFTRTSSVSLGDPWQAVRGLWTTNGTVASSADTPSTYALSAVPMATGDFTAKASFPAAAVGGLGIAFWVSDANSWWASVVYNSTTTSSSCSGGYTSSGSNPPSSSCCSGVSSSTACDTGLVISTSNPPSASCCSGISVGASSCNDGYVTAYSSPPASNCCSSITTMRGTCGSGLSYCLYNGDPYYCCNGSSYLFPASTIYACYTATTTQYSCYTSNSTTYSCYTTTTSSTTYRDSVYLYSSVSGTVATQATTLVASSSSTYPTVGSIAVSVSGNTIVTNLYSDTAWTTSRGTSQSFTATSPQKGPGIGVIKSASAANQGTQIDNFTATVI